ncbi:MAG TPA: polysaccharide biosynthesis tyrosine autokinase [Candidatus Alistipes stercoravium]|nr:polysaccharide biosynthesis tyrosine autokinase [Candidatus Alistipes stercoravium]
METTPNLSQNEQADDPIQIKDIFFLCLSQWKWFVLSLLITLGLAFLYLLRTPSVYTRNAAVLIKENTKGQSLPSDLEFSDMGLFQSSTNVNNELLVMQSPATMLEVVKRLHLDMNYLLPGRFHDQVAYGSSLPISVTTLDLTENGSGQFAIDFQKNGAIELSEFARGGEDLLPGKTIRGKLLDTLSTPLGRIVVEPAPHFNPETRYPRIKVSKSNLYGAVGAYSSKLTASINDKKASVIDLAIKDVSIQRAEDILNTLISVYNENWVRDKNQIAVSTSMFINERLNIIEQELGNVDENISSYKSENQLPDVQAASSIYMAESSEANAQIMNLNNQLYMTKYVRNYLTNEANKTQLLPANSGIEGGNIESQIAEYNTLLLQRNNLVSNSSTQNPLVIDMDQSLSEMRKAIVVSIDNVILTLNTKIGSLQQNKQQATARIAANPTQAKYLLSVERQQKVKEALYLFLLQKREENELSQAFTAYNTRVITPPSGSMAPTSPVKRNIFLIAIILGLAIPVGVIFLLETMNTKIRGRKDIEKLSIPFIGEIPQWGSRRNRLSKKSSKETTSVVVQEGARDIINEAFRVVRTNLEFIIGKGDKSSVIVFTSFNPGSGKSFLTMNIATCLAIKGKRVLVIDGDLRHGSTSAYVGSPRHGLSDYLSGNIDNVDQIIVADKSHDTMHVLPVGTIPPNPTELLEEPRFGELISRLRSRYDYILIDCPPIEVVADTQIIEKAADRTIFVVRADLLERSMLPVLENIYKEKRFKNMMMILNGTNSRNIRYGYGSRHGYHYGYGYYAYGSSKQTKN